MSELHPHESKILRALVERGAALSFEELSKLTGIPENAVARAVSWLSTKRLIRVREEERELLSLSAEGLEHLKRGLPERRVIEAVESGQESVEELEKLLGKELLSIGLGWLRKKGKAEVVKGRVRILNSLKEPEEELLELIGGEKLEKSSLPQRLREAAELLKRRGLVEVERVLRREVELEERAEKLALELTEGISQLTHEVLRSGEWRRRGLRRYDVELWVQPSYPARKHPLQLEIERIRRIFLELGFKEITGPLVESAFWNFDALFQPQDHPARDMHDTFYVKLPRGLEIEGFDELKEKVKSVHEDGWTTGSSGWREKWSEEVAREFLLRTHTTALTCRYLSKLKREDLPAKVFCVGKVFRNEKMDYKHLPEFHQVEGIVASEDANFKQLLGILKEFYARMGFERVRFRPAYFPYTELSIEPEVWVEGRKEWIELGGAGIFRPEVVIPLLGFDCPVLAWGLGVERMVALRLGLTDIRQLYLSDIDWLRKTPLR